MEVASGKISSPEDVPKVEELLKDLRDNPIGTNDPNCNSALGTCSSLLFSLTYPDSPPLAPHWFCDKSPPVAVEAATFLLRLHAYMKADDWRSRLASVLKGCVACVRGYSEAKARSDET